MDGLRILQVVTDRDRRGAQVFAMDLAAGLAELGHDVETVALTAGTHGDLLPIGALGSSRRSWATLRNLRRHASNKDVVVAHGSATLLACAVALVGTSVAFVYRQVSDPLFWAATWFRRLRVAVMIRRSRTVVALSEITSRVLQQHYRLGAGRIAVIPNAVPEANFHPPTDDERKQARRVLDLPADRSILVYVGALAPEKGVEHVVRATADIDGMQALIVGDGPDRARLEQLAARLAPDRIEFAGPVDDPRLAYWAADVLALPSLGGDTMPAVLIEAGLCGTACVTTPVGAITDIVLDGKTGRVVPIGDGGAFREAVRELLRDPHAAERLGRAAAERCRSLFTIGVTAPAWSDVLHSCASRSNK